MRTVTRSFFRRRTGWPALGVALLTAAATISVAGQAADQGGGGGGGRGGAQGQGGGRAGGPARDQTAQLATGTGAISGSVTTAGTGAPVRRARVTLGGASPRAAITDDQGGFAFTSLPAGRFTLAASKAGYVNMTYGAKKPGRAGTPIQLAEGQKLDKASISLPKGSVVTGIVVDENGDPSPGTQVRALKFAVQTGEKTLQQAGSDTTDDRGMYRIYALQPGDYLVSAVPRNQGLGDAQQVVMAEIEALLAQAQGGGGRGGGQGGGRGGGGGAAGLANLLAGAGGGRAGQQLLDRAAQLQAQLQQQEQAQNVGYAPVYYPGTTTAPAAQTVVLNLSEERSNIDFQLRLVPMVKVEGTISGPEGALQGAQIRMMPTGQSGFPTVPGLGENMARADASGKFTFNSVTPGPYTILASAPVRDPSAQAQGGPAGFGAPGAAGSQAGPGGQGQGGGRGGRGGAVTQVLWASTDISVSGTNVSGVALSLQPGMTVTGRIAFESGAAETPTDLTRVRVMLTPQGNQAFDMGPAMTQATVDANGQFKITGISPGRYTIRANFAGPGRGQQGQAGAGTQVGAGQAGAAAAQAGAGQAGAGRGGAGAAQGAGGAGAAGGGRAAGAGGAGAAAATGQTAAAQTNSWALKSAMFAGRDALDFSLEIRPNEDANGVLTFTDKRQELSGTIQDATGRPTSDFTIIVFPQENQYWTPNSRRIAAPRPNTDGRFTINSLPPGLYRLTAVTDAETGEWYDPAFLSQLMSVSIPVTIQPGEKKVQDIKLAGGRP